MLAASPCDFNALFSKNVPHILEKIFFSLDYESFKACLEVSKSWKGMLTSEYFKVKSKSVFLDEILKIILKASREGKVQEIRSLFSSGICDRNCINLDDNNSSDVPLCVAAKNGHGNVVQLLLDNGADLNKRDNYGITPLNRAGATPLHWAAEEGHKDVVKLLIVRGADPNQGVGEVEWTPLQKAAYHRHKGVAQILIDGGASTNIADKYGRTPLHWAAAFGQRDLVEILLDAGADPERECVEDGETPLHWAADEGHQDVVKLLIERGG